MLQYCNRTRSYLSHSQLVVAGMVMLVLLLSACGGNNEEAASGEGPATEAATATEATANTTPEAAAETTPEAAVDAAAADGPVSVVPIESVDSIQSFRMRFSLTGLEGEQVSVEGEYVKEPSAQRLLVTMPGARSDGLETLVVGESRYTKVRNRWIQTPGNRFDMDEIAPFTPDVVVGELEYVEDLGSESVNGRATTHYRVNKEALPPIPFNRNGERQDLSSLGSVQFDLWVDEEEHFVVKMQASVENAETGVPTEMVYEYYDFNAAIVIEAPNKHDNGISSSPR